MKSLVVILFLMAGLEASSQSFVISAVSELTVAGYEAGGMLSFANKRNWRAGFFYQSSLIFANHEQKSENLFYGIMMSAPLIRSEKINFYATVRPGIVNKQFYVISPGFETECKVGKNLSVGIGLGIRKTYPSATLKINYLL
jgi:hypothetical protein